MNDKEGEAENPILNRVGNQNKTTMIARMIVKSFADTNKVYYLTFGDALTQCRIKAIYALPYERMSYDINRSIFTDNDNVIFDINRKEDSTRNILYHFVCANGEEIITNQIFGKYRLYNSFEDFTTNKKFVDTSTFFFPSEIHCHYTYGVEYGTICYREMFCMENLKIEKKYLQIPQTYYMKFSNGVWSECVGADKPYILNLPNGYYRTYEECKANVPIKVFTF